MRKRMSKRRMIKKWNNYNKKLDKWQIQGEKREKLLILFCERYKHNFVNDNIVANCVL